MPMIILKYNKEKNVFIPQSEIDLPDNFEINVPNINPTKGKNKKKMREDFIKYYLNKYPNESLSDIDKDLLDLIGIDAENSSNTSYKDDKKRVMMYIWDKYGV